MKTQIFKINGITAIVIVFTVALAIAMLWVIQGKPGDQPSNLVDQSQDKAVYPKVQADRPALPPGQAIVGGVQRPASDVSNNTPMPLGANEPPKKAHGFSPAIQPETNQQTKLVAEALKTKDKPERFSSFITPNDFDTPAFQADPKGYATQYASEVAPGRVFAPAQPGEGVVPIKANSALLHRVVQGESVRLSVKVVPNAPVTFSSHNLGSFENKLTTTTVVADELGVASVNFTAGQGTIDQVYVLAASPVTSGKATFTVDVVLPILGAKN